MTSILPTPSCEPAASATASPYAVGARAQWLGASRGALVVVASDGGRRSDGAVRVALARAARSNAALEVVTVARWELVGSAEGMALWEQESAARRATQRQAVEEQLERLTGKPRAHGVTVLDGHPAYTISRLAIERRAALVVVGLGLHRLTDRLFADETAIQLARISRVPVLAVPEECTSDPTHAVVAVDFGDLAERAAQAAVDAVGDSGVVELVHVLSYAPVDPFAVGGREACEAIALGRLSDLAGRLVSAPGVRIVPVVLSGRPAHEILAYAERVDADLIASGTHGRGFVARAVMGSVATSLLRGARCPVLTTPRDPLPVMEPRDQQPGSPRPTDDIWTTMLRTFSLRNAGRRTILEMDDLELGAQAQEYNYPLVGTTYDLISRRVDLVLGDGRTGGRHLTRSMGDVLAVDVLTDGKGQDVALRVQHGGSQTLLTFTS